MSIPLKLPPIQKAFEYWKKILKRDFWIYIIGIAGVAGTNIVDVFIPRLIGKNVDALQTTQKLPMRLFWALLLTYVFQFFSRIVWRRTLARQSFKSACQLKSEVWDCVRYFPLSFFHRKITRGEMINLATGDVTSAQNIFGFHFVATTDFFFLLTLSSLAMWFIHPRLMMTSLILFPIIPVLIFFLCKREAKLYDESQVMLSQLNDTVDSIVGSSKLMKLRPYAPLWNDRLLASAKNYQQKRRKLLTTEAQFFPATALPPAFSLAIFLIYGIPLYQKGELSLGQLVAFHAYLFMIADPLSELGWLVSDWQKSFGSLRRLLALLHEEKDPVFSSHAPAHLKETPVEVCQLEFQHSGSSFNTLSVDALTVRAGSRVGIRGEVGSGKSTLARILSGLELDYRGSAKLFGTEARTLVNKDFRQLVALVDQNPFLFGSTLRDNLCLDRKLSDDELFYWLDVVELTADIQRFPRGLDTSLGEWGINLSGGQRQRLTLARALCHRPRLLILDDALSAIDVRTEEKIVSKMEKALKDFSCIVFSHRESSLALCHEIYTLRTPEVAQSLEELAEKTELLT